MESQNVETGAGLTPKEISPQRRIEAQVGWWERKTLTTGEPCLRNGQEMLRTYNPFTSTETTGMAFYHPQHEWYLQRVEAFTQLDEKVKGVTGLNTNRRVHVLLVPDTRYCSRGGGAAPSGDMILIDVSSPDLNRVWIHERIHSLFGQVYGITPLPDLAEGAAMYFSRKVFPNDPRNDYEAYGSQLMLYEKFTSQRGPMGISHTANLERLKVKNGEELAAYEYSYFFGAFLAKHIIENYGREKYLEFYRKTCKKNLFDTTTGQQLIRNHRLCPGVRNRDVIYQALGLVGLNPALIDLELSRTVQKLAQSKTATAGLFQRIANSLQRVRK